MYYKYSAPATYPVYYIRDVDTVKTNEIGVRSKSRNELDIQVSRHELYLVVKFTKNEFYMQHISYINFRKNTTFY